MIQQINHIFNNLDSLTLELTEGEVFNAVKNAQSQLVQIYCSEINEQQLHEITSLICRKLPKAIIIGASTIGEVVNGKLFTGEIVIGFTIFESSEANLIALPCPSGKEEIVGTELGRKVSEYTDLCGVLLLATPLSIDASVMLKGVNSTLKNKPIFGGGAGDHNAGTNSQIFTHSDSFTQGVIAVALCGDDLHIEANTYLGWKPLSRYMTVTKVEGLNVLTVDHKPAFEVYDRYLNIPNNEQFFINALEFPFLLERDGGLLARVPISTNQEDGSLKFVADIREGDKFRLGYGDMDLIVEDSKILHRQMQEFSPQAIFLFSCGCRRFLMQANVDLETAPLQKVAPTFGFYTYGEFIGDAELNLLNSTMVSVGLREGNKNNKLSSKPDQQWIQNNNQFDPYAHQHTRVVTRLLRFIDALTSELETSIEEVTSLSITDQLTQLANRMRLDQVLDTQINSALRYGNAFSVIIFDIDHFKRVNDTYGHLVGDDVLIKIAQLVSNNARDVDIVGRWGGEEFLIISPYTGIDEALILAERLRDAIENADFPTVGKKTASFGVAEFREQDDFKSLMIRVDRALYSAKNNGRNRVEVEK